MAEAVGNVGVVTTLTQELAKTSVSSSSASSKDTQPPAWLPPRLFLDDVPQMTSAGTMDLNQGRITPRVNVPAVQKLRELGDVDAKTKSVWRWVPSTDSLPLPR